MKALDKVLLLLFALVLAVGISACQKQNETDLSSTGTENQASAEPTTDGVTPPVQETPAPATEPAPVTTTKPVSTKHPTSTAPKTSKTVPASQTRTVSLPSGSSFDIELTTPINSGKNNVGDPVEGKLLQPLTADGMVVAEQGAMIRGEITDIKRASRSRSEEDRASAKFQFTSLQTVDGEKSLSASVTSVGASATAGSTTKRDALVIGGSAVAGAVLGKVIGHDTKGAAIGAVGGAMVGTGIVMASKGHEVDLPAGSKVTLRAEQPITVVAR